MPGTGEQPGVGELGRQLQAVLNRFETLANGLEQKFVNKEVNRVDRLLVDETIRGLRETQATLRQTVDRHDEQHATKEQLKALQKEIDDLSVEYKDDKKWIYRLVIGALVIAIISFAISGGLDLNGSKP